MNITEKLKELGYSTVPEEFYTKVQEWKSWYVGDVKGFHRYKVHNRGIVWFGASGTLSIWARKSRRMGEPTYERTG